MKVVLDTNVLVSALFWDGNERALLQDCLEGKHQLVLSVFVLDELGSVLREKFDAPPETVAGYVGQLLAAARIVDPDEHLDVIEEDPADNRVLESALAVQADVLASGDSDLLDLGSFKGIEVRRAADLVDR